MLNYSDAFLLIVPIYIIALIVGVLKKYPISKHIILALISMYITLLIAVTLFPLPISKNLIELRRLDVVSTNNFIPFQSIYDLITNTNISTMLRNIVGNVLLLVPFGFLIPMLFKKLRNLKNIFIASLLFSFMIETTQFLISIILGFNYKIVDVDDVILNVMGGLIGYIAYKLIYAIFKRSTDTIKLS